MSDSILLILRVPGSDHEEVAIERVGDRMDVKSVRKDPSRDEQVAERAFIYAKRFSKRVVALQILTSDLYHWGYNDIILSGPAKMRFIGHVREELLSRSLESATMLEEKARSQGVELEIRRVETRDPVLTALEEAEKGYDSIFIPKEKKRIFPLLSKTLAQSLSKGGFSQIVRC